MMKKLLILFTILAFSAYSFAQTVGDYRSAQDGIWSNVSTWEVYSVLHSWDPASNAPTGSNNITVKDSVGRTSALSMSGNLIIAASGDLNMIGNTLSISGSGTILIQSDNSGTGELLCEGTPTATVQRYIGATDNSYWHQIGVPVTGATAAQIDQNGSPKVWMMEWYFLAGGGNPAQNWAYITDPSTALDYRLGYIVTGDNNFTIDWNGPIITTGFTQNVGLAGNTDDFGIVGNPFTCSLDIMSGGTISGTNLTNQIWTWDPATDNYATYTGGSGGTRSGIVATGQSFFVQIADGSQSTSFGVSASDRLISTSNLFLKKSSSLWDDNFGKGTYLMLKSSDTKASDAIFVNFGENGTNGFENGYDGTKRFGGETAPQLYLVEDNLNLTIDYIKTLSINEERIVKLNFKAGKDGEQLMAANLDSLENTRVTIEDLQTGKMHVFNTEGNYVFNASTNDSPDRFLLHFLYNPTGIENPSSTGVESSMNIYAFNKAVYITNNDNNPIESLVTIYDLFGRQVYSNEISLTSTTKIPINISNSYLIVKVIKGSEVVTQKVFIQ